MNCHCGNNLWPVRLKVESALKEWMCPKCNSLYATVNGTIQRVADEGKLEDWPEMQDYMNKIIQYLTQEQKRET